MTIDEAVPKQTTPEGMKWIPSGRFLMGSEKFYPEEAPVHEVEVAGFWIDTYAVTNREYSRFVRKTGYITVAERPLNPADYPGALPGELVPGALVFRPDARPGRSSRLEPMVGIRPWRKLETSRGPRKFARIAARSPGGPHRIRGRASLRAVGWKASAHRGGMGVCRARRSQR